MPYIGRNHTSGDHVNNFKVLDDISSYTATFDGTATSVVNTTNDTIRVPEHRFIQGQRVIYTNGGGGNIGGLTNGTAYFIIADTANTFKLATSASNATNSIAVNISSVGTGTSHTINASFDGINTRFKITHGNGVRGDINSATQLNIAINNVIQRPNINSASFTEGFSVEDQHKIVFKIAPTSNDIFWGNIIANNLSTFDVSDHKIDTFTGDGSSTEFNLSHVPANNESLMVTINGVLQHPSNTTTSRAYTLIASVLKFTTAPANGDEIQVRHLGFAGATTSDVSGFYGRTGNVVLTDQDDITVNKINVGTGVTIESNGQATFVGVVTFGSGSTTIDNNVVNVGTALTLGHTQGLQFHTQNLHSAGFEVNQINSSGIITASSLDISGNASIGGVLTYEDVTSIDAVGIITARDGIDCNGDIDVDGHTNLDNVSVAGIVTASGGIFLPDGQTLNIGNTSSTGDLQFFSDGTHSHIKTNTLLKFRGEDIRLMNAAGSETFIVCDGDNGGAGVGNVNLYFDSDRKFRTLSYGAQVESATGDTSLTVRAEEDNSTSDAILKTSVTNNNASGYIFFGDNDDGDVGRIRYNHSDNSMNFRTNGVDGRLIIDSNGDVGINETNPTQKLHIGGSIKLTGQLYQSMPSDFWSQSTSFIELNGMGNLTHMGSYETVLTSNGYRDNNAQWKSYGINGNTGAAQIRLNPAGTIIFGTEANKADGDSPHVVDERLRITSGGKVGIGTNNPFFFTDIQADGITGDVLRLTATASGQMMNIQNKAGSSYPAIVRFVSHDGSGFWDLQYNNNDNSFSFDKNDSEKVRITSSGRLGLNTDNPDTTFTIKSGGDAQMSLKNSSGTTKAYLGTDGVFGSASTDDLRIRSDSSNIIFGFSGTERLRITSTGQVKITGADDQDNFIVDAAQTQFKIHQDSTDGEVSLRAEDGSGNNYAKYMTFFVEGGSGSTEKLRITSDGKVGINDISPHSRLTVTTSNEDAVLIKNTNTAQYASARIHLQGPGSADNVTSLVHGQLQAGGGDSYFAIESKTSSHVYKKTLMLYDHNSNHWAFHAGPEDGASPERLRLHSDGSAEIGNNSTASEHDGLRRLDIINRHADGDSGSLLRLVTRDAGTNDITESFDIAKYRSGYVSLANNNAAQPIDTYAAGAIRLRVNGGNGKVNVCYDSPGNANYGNLEVTKSGISNVDPNWSYLSFHRVGQIAWQQGINANDFVIASGGGAARNTLQYEKFRIKQTGGITFNGDTADANALDDYEEGSYTPTATLGSGSITSTTNFSLRYVKIGRLVHIFGRLHFATSQNDLSSFQLSLPFSNSSGNSYDTSCIQHVIRGNGGDPVQGIRILRAGPGGTTMTMNDHEGNSYGDLGTTTPHINVNFSYFAAS